MLWTGQRIKGLYEWQILYTLNVYTAQSQPFELLIYNEDTLKCTFNIVMPEASLCNLDSRMITLYKCSCLYCPLFRTV